MTSLFAGCFAQSTSARDRARLAFVGLPDDSQSSHRRGCARGPQHIRAAYNGDCYNAATELGVDLSELVADLGDLTPRETFAATARAYQTAAEELLRSHKIPFFAGGDHAVTVPIAAALAVLGEPVHVVQIDAHPDLYEEFEGSRTSHACVAARLLEMPHIASVTQLGIRTMNNAQRRLAERHQDRLHIVSASEWPHDAPPRIALPRDASVFVTIDIDAFDPAHAPGVSHPVPGGITPRQGLDLLHALRARIVTMDVVELNPTRDVNDLTAVLAGRLLHEGMGIAQRQLTS